MEDPSEGKPLNLIKRVVVGARSMALLASMSRAAAAIGMTIILAHDILFRLSTVILLSDLLKTFRLTEARRLLLFYGLLEWETEL